MALEEIRQQYPQYNEWSDKKLGDAIYKKFYAGKVPREQFDREQGLEKANTGKLRTALEQFAQGATFGFSDEIMDVIAAGTAGLAGYDPREAYAEARRTSERDIKAQQEEHPWISGGAQIVGGLVTGVAGAGTKAGQKALSSIGAGGLKSRVVAGSKLGAFSGGAYGIGSGFGAEERVKGGAIGAVGGAVIGGALPAAGALSRYGVQKGKDAFRSFKGPEALSKLGKAEKDIVKQYQQRPDVEEAATSARKALTEAKESGVTITSAEALDDEVLQRELGVLREDPNVQGAVQKFFQERSKSAEKALDDLQQGISPVQTVDDANSAVVTAAREVKDAKMKSLRAEAAPLYDAAYQTKDVQSKLIDRILNTPSGKKALKHARTKMADDMSLMGLPDKELGELARDMASYGKMKPSKGGVAKGLNLRSLDYVKRSFDDMIGAAQRSGEKDQVRILTSLKSRMVNELDELSPDYKAARGLYSESITEMDEIMKGRFTQLMNLSDIGEEQATAKLFQGTAGATKKLAEQLPKEARLKGASGQLLRVIDDNKQSPLTVSSKLGFGTDVDVGSRKVAQQWESMLGDKYPKFVSMMNTLNRAHKGQRAAMGSMTQQKLSAASRLKKDASEILSDAAIGNRLGVINSMRSFTRTLLDPRSSDQFIKDRAEILMSERGVELVEAVAKSMKENGIQSNQVSAAMSAVEKYLTSSGALSAGGAIGTTAK